MYRQCVLQRGTEGDVAWIPEIHAKPGKFLRIGDENGWQVKEVGSFRREESYLLEHERDYLTQRRASDI